MKKIDIIWLIEHVARELDVACAVKVIAENKYGINVEIKNIYQHTEQVIRNYLPDIVVHPFFYFKDGAIATQEYYDAWPGSIHFNLAWEELHYNAHKKIKAPSDAIAKKQIIHHAWGDFYKEYLMTSDVPASNIFVNGNPAYQLYKKPYNRYFFSRKALAEKYNLNLNHKWLFIPENFRWAFIGDKYKLFTKLGADPDQLEIMEAFSLKSLVILLQWCKTLKEINPNIEIIFRPRPAVNTRQILDVYNDHVSREGIPFYIIKDESVRDWILASDVVISSYSTTLIEAAIAGKPHYMIEPIQIPDALMYDWYQHIQRIENFERFQSVCEKSENHFENHLRTWAENEMLAKGDPIEALADYIYKLLEHHKVQKRVTVNHYKSIKFKKKYFNEQTHEKDLVDDALIDSCCNKWRTIVYPAENNINKIVTVQKKSVLINKTMDRDDLMNEEALIVCSELNQLIEHLYDNDVAMSSWVGTIPDRPIQRNLASTKKTIFEGPLPPDVRWLPGANEYAALQRGLDQRLNYSPLDDAMDDIRIPWFLYWEIYWTLRCTRAMMQPGMKILDAGGTASLFTCYLASKGYEIHSIDLNKKLKYQGDIISQTMGWNMNSYTMNIMDLDFPDNYFDHAFSICVFEHLDYEIKISALKEIARCLKPNGMFGITFDYRNPAPGIFGYGKDTRGKNQLKTTRDIERSFLSNKKMTLYGNESFYDNQQSYLVHEKFDNTPFTFGSLFLKNNQ